MEILFTFLERHVPSATVIWKGAMNRRIGQDDDLPLDQVYKIAYEKGIDTAKLPTIPE